LRTQEGFRLEKYLNIFGGRKMKKIISLFTAAVCVIGIGGALVSSSPTFAATGKKDSEFYAREILSEIQSGINEEANYVSQAINGRLDSGDDIRDMKLGPTVNDFYSAAAGVGAKRSYGYTNSDNYSIAYELNNGWKAKSMFAKAYGTISLGEMYVDNDESDIHLEFRWDDECNLEAYNSANESFIAELPISPVYGPVILSEVVGDRQYVLSVSDICRFGVTVEYLAGIEAESKEFGDLTELDDNSLNEFRNSISNSKPSTTASEAISEIEKDVREISLEDALAALGIDVEKQQADDRVIWAYKDKKISLCPVSPEDNAGGGYVPTSYQILFTSRKNSICVWPSVVESGSAVMIEDAESISSISINNDAAFNYYVSADGAPIDCSYVGMIYKLFTSDL